MAAHSSLADTSGRPWPAPTSEVVRLVRVIGPEATLALLEARAGARIYIPHRADPDGELARVIGVRAVEALMVARAPGDYLKVPVARQWRILVYHAQGSSYAEIARRAGCSLSTVWRVLSEAHCTTSQLDLFDR